jgi:hypothetical protein
LAIDVVSQYEEQKLSKYLLPPVREGGAIRLVDFVGVAKLKVSRNALAAVNA